MSILSKLASSTLLAWKRRILDAIARQRRGIGPILRLMELMHEYGFAPARIFDLEVV